MALEDLKESIASLRGSPFISITPQETAGLETLKGLTDTSGLYSAAKRQFEDVSSPEIMARLTASGFGRSGAVGESLAKGFAQLALPIEQAGFQARNVYGQAQLGVGQQIAARGQSNLQAVVNAQALLERLGFSREEAVRNASQFAQELEQRARALGISSEQFAQNLALQKAAQEAQTGQFAKTFGLSERELELNRSIASINASRGGGATGAGTGAGLTGSPFSAESQRVMALNRIPATPTPIGRDLVRGDPPPTKIIKNAPGFDTGTTSMFGGGPGGSWNFGGGNTLQIPLSYSQGLDLATSPFDVRSPAINPLIFPNQEE